MKKKDSVVRARIDSDLKAQAAQVLSGCGLELSDAIRLFLQQVVLQEAIPFPIEAMRRVERLPTRLIVRESCGCGDAALPGSRASARLGRELIFETGPQPTLSDSIA